jgi:peroxiredoxin
VKGIDAALPQFEASGAQVVGISTDAPQALHAWSKELSLHHPLLGDFRRQVLPQYGALVTDEKSPIFQRGKRAYYVIDKHGVVKYMKVMDNPLDLVEPSDLLAAVKAAGVS